MLNEQTGNSENLSDRSERGFSPKSAIRARGKRVRIFQGALDDWRRESRVTIWDEPAPESRVVQGRTFQGRDWKCGMDQVGKRWALGYEYRGRKSWVTNCQIFSRARGGGDEASQPFRSLRGSRGRILVLCIRASPRRGSKGRVW